jgi:hydroxymethylpyrimidine/phosphomethylpyrimidine kinase
MTAIALTIAGSDSSGGAGIQADLKTFAALEVYGASVIAALTAQNTRGVESVLAVPAGFVLAEMRAVAADLDVRAIKIGMLGTNAVIDVVVEGLKLFPRVPIVLDPVMAAASGDRLLDVSAIGTLRGTLLPLATLITPNLAEGAALLDEAVATSEADMAAQARKLLNLGAKAVLLKGGHAAGPEAVDIFVDGEGEIRLAAPRHATRNTHGTGCTLSAAIAAELAKGATLRAAIETAKAYVTAAIAGADMLGVGKGRGPLHHFHAWWSKK